MSIPLTIANYNGFNNNSRSVAVHEFTIGQKGQFTRFDIPFLEWIIQDANQENVIGDGEGVMGCKYLLTRDVDVTQQTILDSPDLHPGGLSGFIKPLGYYAGGVRGVYDEYGGPYTYDYYADGTFRAGCNFELSIIEELEEGLWRLYAIALSKDGLWGPIS